MSNSYASRAVRQARGIDADAYVGTEEELPSDGREIRCFAGLQFDVVAEHPCPVPAALVLQDNSCRYQLDDRVAARNEGEMQIAIGIWIPSNAHRQTRKGESHVLARVHCANATARYENIYHAVQRANRMTLLSGLPPPVGAHRARSRRGGVTTGVRPMHGPAENRSPELHQWWKAVIRAQVLPKVGRKSNADLRLGRSP